ncbi:YD repeat (two copies) [Treponema socranskii subsp. paredis ATCC 35535]|nr:YD repeat (two copies) [Treponema socranskii subsp. paredis ATCC 35535]
MRPRSEPIGEASSEAGWRIKRRLEMKIYDAARNPIAVTYDMLGRKTELTTKDGGAKRYTYDELHLLYEKEPEEVRHT